MTKTIKKKPDFVLLSLMGALILLGLLILASVSSVISFKKFGNTYYYLNHQLLFGILPGLIFGYAAYKIDIQQIKKRATYLISVALLMMMMVFMPFIGSASTGSARWIYLGHLSFQPSEFLKLAFIIYLAALLSSRIENKTKTDFKNIFVAFLGVCFFITTLLYLQSDISTLGVILITGSIMYFSINTPLWHSLVVIALGFTGLVALIKLASYRMNRFLVFLNPDLDPGGIGYQAGQALIAIGAGGITGVGLGMGVHKLGFLPETISDCIFAIFSEETGFIGSTLLIILFLAFLWKGLRLTQKTPDKFSQITALGITCWIVIQSFVNIGAMIGILPLTGIPLPFVSYGGSALAIELTAMGLLLNISKS